MEKQIDNARKLLTFFPGASVDVTVDGMKVSMRIVKIDKANNIALCFDGFDGQCRRVLLDGIELKPYNPLSFFEDAGVNCLIA